MMRKIQTPQRKIQTTFRPLSDHFRPFRQFSDTLAKNSDTPAKNSDTSAKNSDKFRPLFRPLFQTTFRPISDPRVWGLCLGCRGFLDNQLLIFINFLGSKCSGIKFCMLWRLSKICMLWCRDGRMLWCLSKIKRFARGVGEWLQMTEVRGKVHNFPKPSHLFINSKAAKSRQIIFHHKKLKKLKKRNSRSLAIKKRYGETKEMDNRK